MCAKILTTYNNQKMMSGGKKQLSYRPQNI